MLDSDAAERSRESSAGGLAVTRQRDSQDRIVQAQPAVVDHGSSSLTPREELGAFPLEAARVNATVLPTNALERIPHDGLALLAVREHFAEEV